MITEKEIEDIIFGEQPEPQNDYTEDHEAAQSKRQTTIELVRFLNGVQFCNGGVVDGY